MVVGQIRFLPITHKEQIPQEPDEVPLLATAQQAAYRHVQEFAQQIQAGSFDGGHPWTGPQIEGLLPPGIFFSALVQVCL